MPAAEPHNRIRSAIVGRSIARTRIAPWVEMIPTGMWI
jgi:hypothetical protein